MHPLPDGWKFDGNLESPTFEPSFRHTYGPGQPDRCCHYSLIKGVLHFAKDCSHAMRSQSVPLPPLPDWMTDE